MALVAGCRPPAQIRTYTVPKERTGSTSARSAAQATHRMRAVVIPRGDAAWFFKAVATLEEMATLAPAIEKFYTSLDFPHDADQPSWRLPEDWSETASSGMRTATLQMPVGDASVEMTVTSLPWGADAGGMLANVNRWRRQMNLPPIGPGELGGVTRDLDIADQEYVATLVDLRGHFRSPGMTAPMPERASRQFTGIRPSEAAGVPHFDTPESWQAMPPTSMVQAAFRIEQAGYKADLKVSNFAATPGMADPLGNVNRWRGELKLEPITANALNELSETVEIDGLTGTMFHLQSKTEPPEATLVAMVERDGQMWFFKMRGDATVIDAEQEKFHGFLKSVRFNPPERPADGDN